MVEFGIIKEACKAAKSTTAFFPVAEISVKMNSLPGFFKFITVSDNHPFIDSFQFNSRFGKVRTCVLIVLLTLRAKSGK